MDDDATEQRDKKIKTHRKTDITTLGEQMGLFFSFESLDGDRNSYV